MPGAEVNGELPPVDRPRIEAIGIVEGPGDVADNVDR